MRYVRKKGLDGGVAVRAGKQAEGAELTESITTTANPRCRVSNINIDNESGVSTALLPDKRRGKKKEKEGRESW